MCAGTNKHKSHKHTVAITEWVEKPAALVDAAAEKATIASARKEAKLGAAAERESAVSLAHKREETLVARAEASDAGSEEEFAKAFSRAFTADRV